MPIKISKADILTLALPIKEPFTVSFGTISERIILIIKLYTPDGLVGYGECDSFHFPTYVPDFTAGERLILKDFILPALLGKENQSIADAVASYSFIKGHNFAKTAAESALWHIHAQQENVSLKHLFGGTRNEIEIGESIGIKKSIEETLEEITLRLKQGFKRIKIKIKHGWDLKLTHKIRDKYPDIPLMLDANSDYSLADIEMLKKLDDFNLMMIEQPLGYDDIVDHSILQKELKTPICLDESILSFDDARRALFLQSCKIINIKPPRVGGPLESIRIHDHCAKNNIPVWCGGLLETGIGRAFNIALASLPNFSLPADMSETRLFYNEDIVSNPYEIKNGLITVPTKPGLGFEIKHKTIKKYTVDELEVKN